MIFTAYVLYNVVGNCSDCYKWYQLFLKGKLAEGTVTPVVGSWRCLQKLEISKHTPTTLVLSSRVAEDYHFAVAGTVFLKVL